MCFAFVQKGAVNFIAAGRVQKELHCRLQTRRRLQMDRLSLLQV